MDGTGLLALAMLYESATKNASSSATPRKHSDWSLTLHPIFVFRRILHFTNFILIIGL